MNSEQGIMNNAVFKDFAGGKIHSTELFTIHYSLFTKKSSPLSLQWKNENLRRRSLRFTAIFRR